MLYLRQRRRVDRSHRRLQHPHRFPSVASRVVDPDIVVLGPGHQIGGVSVASISWVSYQHTHTLSLLVEIYIFSNEAKAIFFV